MSSTDWENLRPDGTPHREPKTPMPQQTERDQNYLKDRGWRLITSQRAKYGLLYYWDHSDHQRRDGRWWVQGDAVRKQKALDKVHGTSYAPKERE